MDTSPTPPTTPAQLISELDQISIQYQRHEHPPVVTVEEARQHCGHIRGGHCKNLLLRTRKKQNWLLVLPADAWVDLQTFAQSLAIGPLSFASPQRLFELLGVVRGAVTPLALINDRMQAVNVVFEKSLLEHRELNFHPLVNSCTLTIPTEEVLRFVKHCGHEPLITELPERPFDR